MSRKNTYQQVSPQTQEEAVKIARATQRPGQTKEQTKLIAQGIQKGIAHYKKQQKAKARELDKKLRKTQTQQSDDHLENETVVIYRQSKLAWLLLLLSWVGFIAYLMMTAQ